MAGSARRRWVAGFITLLLTAWVIPAAVASQQVLHPDRQPHPDAAGLGEPVRITGEGGVALVGRWHPVAKALGTVILLHGYGRDKTQMLPAAHFLHQARMNTLAYDARAHGESGGTMTTVGALEALDLGKVLDWLADKGVHQNVGALGYSMGAATAVLTAARDPRLSAVAIEGCYSSLNALLGVAFPVFFHLPSFPYAPLAVRLTEWQAHISAADLRPVDQIARLGNRPVFIIGGMADRIATPGQTLDLAHSALHSQLWLIPAARHVEGFETAPAEYKRRLTAFFQTALTSSLAGGWPQIALSR